MSGASTWESVTLDVADGVGTLRLARPPLNILDQRMQREIVDAAREADRRPDIAAVVVWGGDRAFAAGADISEMAMLDANEMQTHSVLLQQFTTAVAAIGKPTAAAVNGPALGGGCELALAADVRFAGAGARIGLPEIGLGIMPGAGGTQRLARLIGSSRAKQLIFTGRILTAAEAAEIGLIDEVVADADVHARAVAWAAQFVSGPGVALRAAKRSIDLGANVPLDEATEVERREFVPLFDTADQSIGMQAFARKQPPSFIGR